MCLDICGCLKVDGCMRFRWLPLPSVAGRQRHHLLDSQLSRTDRMRPDTFCISLLRSPRRSGVPASTAISILCWYVFHPKDTKQHVALACVKPKLRRVPHPTNHVRSRSSSVGELGQRAPRSSYARLSVMATLSLVLPTPQISLEGTHPR